MRTIIVLGMGLSAAIGLMGLTATRALAADDADEHGAKVTIPDTVDGIFKEIHERDRELTDVVKDKKLAEVHHYAYAIRDLANALPARATADNRKRVEGTTKSIAKLAEDLDAAGDANDQAKTEANLKKLNVLITNLDSEFGIKGSSNAAVTLYTCPMHHEVVQDHAGNCPKCGMELVPKQ